MSDMQPIERESALAEKLKEQGLIGESEWAPLMEALRGMAADSRRPVSLLYALEETKAANTAEILAFLSRDSGMPLISLDRFVPQQAAFSAVAKDFLVRRGAIPFETMDRALLVAVLNPYDKTLQHDVKAAAARECFFYLAAAPQYERALTFVLNT
jgi:hypothetical protein